MVPDPVDLASLRRALVVKLRHHGDTLLAAPVLGVLKTYPPACVREEDADAYTQLTVYTRSPWWRRFAGKAYRRLCGA